MGGDFKRGDPAVIRMGARIERVAEKIDDARPAVFTGRQTDAVDHQQRNRAAGGPLVAIGRGNETRTR